MEEWKDYIYNYQVSNLGRLKNKVTGKILKLRPINKAGYLGTVVTLGSKTRTKMIIIHRAVAQTFIPNPYNLPEVNHKSGNKKDNSVGNLCWITSVGNKQHAKITGLVHNNGENNSQCKISDDDAIWIKTHFIKGDKRYGARALARRFNVSHQAILYIINERCVKE